MKILFQGDSITDAERDRNDPHDLGRGYPRFAAAMISDAYPDTEFEFLDLGISGNRSGQLLERLDQDLIAHQPDVVSILIGINDVWHRHSKSAPVQTTDEELEANYRTILSRIRKETDAKILMISPFLLYAPEKASWRGEVDRAIAITERLAREFADAYLPLDEIFTQAEASPKTNACYSIDGVHPNEDGAAFIGEQYLGAIAPLLQGQSDAK